MAETPITMKATELAPESTALVTLNSVSRGCEKNAEAVESSVHYYHYKKEGSDNHIPVEKPGFLYSSRGKTGIRHG
jgi:hypothetical protein